MDAAVPRHVLGAGPAGGHAEEPTHRGTRHACGDRSGIAAVHATLLKRVGDAHLAEHQMIEALAETLWEAQSTGAAPDEQKYLQRLQALSGGAL